MHPARIHGYPARKVRNPVTGENDQIRVISLWCEASRLAGRPYTIRILPDFLIPRSVIRLDLLIEAAEAPGENLSIDQLCLHLGCIDPRTVRRRLATLHDAVNTVSLELSIRRSAAPELGDIPISTPDTEPLKRCRQLYQREIQACERAGSLIAMLPPLIHLIQATMWKTGVKRPSVYASPEVRPP